jgi:HEPN/Toprim N-terminal domain 1
MSGCIGGKRAHRVTLPSPISAMPYPIVTSKGDVAPELMTMFRERDRAEIRLLGPDWPPMIWGPPDPDCGDATATVYRCSAREAIDRLNVMGFTMKRVEENFERIRELELRRLEELSAEGTLCACSFEKSTAGMFGARLPGHSVRS